MKLSILSDAAHKFYKKFIHNKQTPPMKVFRTALRDSTRWVSLPTGSLLYLHMLMYIIGTQLSNMARKFDFRIITGSKFKNKILEIELNKQWTYQHQWTDSTLYLCKSKQVWIRQAKLLTGQQFLETVSCSNAPDEDGINKKDYKEINWKRIVWFVWSKMEVGIIFYVEQKCFGTLATATCIIVYASACRLVRN